MSSLFSSSLFRLPLVIPIATAGTILLGLTWHYYQHRLRQKGNNNTSCCGDGCGTATTSIIVDEEEKRASLYAVGAYTKLSAADVASILSSYSLGTYVAHKELNGGLSNSNYRIDVKDHQGVKPYLLKVCDNKTRDELLSQIAALLVFQHHHLSLSYPVARTDGTHLSTYNNKNVIIYDWLEGATPKTATHGIMSELAIALAAVHTVPLSKFGALPEFPMGLSEMVPFLETEVKNFSSVAHDPFITWLQSHIIEFTSLIHESIPWGVLHGDLFLENCMFQDELCVGLIDFEEMCRGPLMLDVAMTLVGCAYNESNILNTEYARSFLTAYHTHRPITSRERLLFPHFLAYACAAIAFWRFRQFNVRLPNAERRNAHQCMVERANEAWKQADRLIALIPQ